MLLYALITLALLLSGALMLALTFTFHTDYGKSHRLRDGQSVAVTSKGFRANAVVNAVLSVSLVYGLTWALDPFLYDHDKHHRDMRAMNFASVTPLWDRLLGTEEP